MLKEDTRRPAVMNAAAAAAATARSKSLLVKGRISRVKSLLASRSMPILFVSVCFLIIANTKCDQVSSTNASSSGGKYDPLELIREIYLDDSSKVITLLSSPASDTVQKFHPNGRYGRRSVNNFSDGPSAHIELAKLRFDGEATESQPLGSLLHLDNLATQTEFDATNNQKQQQRQHLRLLLANKLLSKSNHLRQQQQHQADRQQQQQQQQQQNNKDSSQETKATFQTNGSSSRQLNVAADSSQMENQASYRTELNKLLKCNYSGVPNLFWCDS